MTNDPDQLLRDRFARLTDEAEAPDWSDVVRRARRISAPPRRWTRPRAVLAVALFGAFAVAGSAIALSTTSTGVPPIDELLDRASRPPERAAPNAPQVDVRPSAGSVSEPLSFASDGTRFTAVGFRSQQGAICSALVESEATPDRVQGGVGCLAEPLLRRALETSSVHVFAGGGGGEGHQRSVQGFARADVVSVSLVDGNSSSGVGLSEPWKPEPWVGGPIRFFYTLMVQAEGEPVDSPPGRGLRIKARLANGTSVEIIP